MLASPRNLNNHQGAPYDPGCRTLHSSYGEASRTTILEAWESLIPPETETRISHNILHAKYEHFINEQDNDGTLCARELDEYFLHNCALHESGHDTIRRLEKHSANSSAIDLQPLRYKYEIDMTTLICEILDDVLGPEDLDPVSFPPSVETYITPQHDRSCGCPPTSAEWFALADFCRGSSTSIVGTEARTCMRALLHSGRCGLDARARTKGGSLCGP